MSPPFTTLGHRCLPATLTGILLMATLPAQAFSERRLIVAFGTPGSPAFVQLADAVESLRCRLADREVDVVFIDTEDLQAVDPGASDSPSVQRALASRSPEAGDFELVLLGKDGGVKWRQDDPGALETMLARIDGMPMRRAEVRRAGGADQGCRARE